MKKKTTNIIIGVIAAVVVVAAVCIIAFSGGKAPDVPSDPTETSTADVTVGDIKIDDPTTGTVDDPDETTSVETEMTDPVPDDGNALTIGEETVIPTAPVSTTKDPAGEVAHPVTEKTPTDDGNGNTGGSVTIGGNQEEPYNCGTPGHHCDGPETHAYILNLEHEGCPYCHKSDCPSFYATDEWGNTCYTPSKCPNYDVHKDPVYYCQTCGKKCGDGGHGTCVQFVTACSCPNCGKWVDAWTCHTCEN